MSNYSQPVNAQLGIVVVLAVDIVTIGRLFMFGFTCEATALLLFTFVALSFYYRE